jgi:histidinol-phosphate aminotransferase
VLSLDPGFVMYRMIALFAGMRLCRCAAAADDFGLDLDATLLPPSRRARGRRGLIAYPNNPTGNLFDADAMEQILEASPGLVVVDEAYAPFTDKSFLPRLGEWPNLLVMRTVSKMGLAGLRLGLCWPARPTWLGEIDKVRLPYNINVLTQASAAFRAAPRRHAGRADRRHPHGARRTVRRAGALSTASPPTRATPTSSCTRTGPAAPAPSSTACKDRGVLIKKLDGAHPLLADCLRITVGTPDENAADLLSIPGAGRAGGRDHYHPARQAHRACAADRARTSPLGCPAGCPRALT